MSPGSFPSQGILSPRRKRIPNTAIKSPTKINTLPNWLNSGIIFTVSKCLINSYIGLKPEVRGGANNPSLKAGVTPLKK